MKIDGCDFNEEWVKSVSESEFVAHEMHGPLSERQLREAYRLICPPKPKTENPKPSVKEDNKEEEQAP